MNFRSIFIILFCCVISNLFAQIYNIDLNSPEKKIKADHLKMGGENFKGEKISINNYYLSINDEPVIPVTGEFHYSRYPHQYWDESIKKMKANGIEIIASYVFWNIHEEIEGIFNWKGDNNLRNFVDVCEQNDLKVIIRLGPFCHGEIRNGGLPDWLFGKPLTIRSNDPNYLFYVERLYTEIGKQINGLYFKDGGPIIAVQLENEFQHSAAPWGLTYPSQPHDWTSAQQDRQYTMPGVGSVNKKNPYAHLGSEHMKILKGFAQKAGIDVPLYTATGWGNAAIIENETLPVTAAYAYPTWASKSLSDFYTYTNLQKDPDYAPIRYNSEDYPYFAAEISGGIMITYNRRPTVPAKSLSSLINRFIGSGANGIGYYMFHGGSTPIGEKGFLSDEAYGYPKISYDFQAPIGEFGQPSESYNHLKVLHYFLNDFGNIIAPMSVIVPEQSNKDPNDISTLRYAVRKSRESGFICMLNFQDDLETKNISNIQFQLETQNGKMLIPESQTFTLKSDENAIFPFNLNLSGIKLNYATAQLLTKLDNNDSDTYVFFSIDGIAPEFSIQNSGDLNIKGINCEINTKKNRFLVQFSTNKIGKLLIDDNIQILLINKTDALNSWKANINGTESMIFSNALILQKNNSIEILSKDDNIVEFEVYPKSNSIPKIDFGTIEELPKNEAIRSHYKITLPSKEVTTTITKISDNKISLSLPKKDDRVNDLFISIDYFGDTGMAFLDGKLITDHFYYGKKWEIGLKRFYDSSQSDEMIFYFRPLYKDAPFFQDFSSNLIPDFSNSEKVFNLNEIHIFSEYKVNINF